jgi:hypothetical protein
VVIDSSGKSIVERTGYNESTRLLKEPSFVRSFLGPSSLVNTASANFQQTALLLVHHIDVFCEWIYDLDLDNVGVAGLEMMENEASSDALQQQNDITLKRKMTVQTSPVAKKAARAETQVGRFFQFFLCSLRSTY